MATSPQLLFIQIPDPRFHVKQTPRPRGSLSKKQFVFGWMLNIHRDLTVDSKGTDVLVKNYGTCLMGYGNRRSNLHSLEQGLGVCLFGLASAVG